jgi:dTDP-4-dehydrorhamnose reductase
MVLRILVLGRNGQLATSIRSLAGAWDVELISAGRSECDLRDLAFARGFFEAQSPDVIINTAAYTDVEAAEVEIWPAVKLNGLAVRNVAEYCHSTKTPLVHISTDFVYDGEKVGRYDEADSMRPISSYGYSKALGDAAVMELGGTILRTAWLFSGHNRNFARTMISLAQTNEVVRVVDDQLGTPTCADDLAEACLDLGVRLASGEKHPPLYLASGSEDASWADVAEAVFVNMAKLGLRRPRLERISTSEYPTKAKRPKNARMDTTLFRQAFPDYPCDWRPAVARSVASVLGGDHDR